MTNRFLFCLCTLILVFLIFWLYYPILSHLINKINTSQDFDYAYLTPLILGFLLLDKREALRSVIKISDMRGFLVFVLGIIMFWIGELAGEYYIQYLSIIIVLLGLVLSLFGLKFLKHLACIFLTVIFFIPFPDLFTRLATSQLQLLSSSLGVKILRIFGKSVYLEGNIIDLGGYKLQVVDACSGLRYVLPLLVLSILLGCFLNLSIWARLFLLAVSVPVAILANALRIASISIIGEYFGFDIIKGTFHSFEGFYVFIFALCLLVLIAFMLKRLFKSNVSISSKFKEDRISSFNINFHSWMLVTIMTTVVIVSLVIHVFVNFREVVPISESLDKFPMKLNGWVGKRNLMSRELIEELDFSSYVLADFHDPNGHVVNLYVAYYETQRKGESIHSPATCLRSSGWTFLNAGPVYVDVPGEGRLKVHSALLQKLNQKQEVFYWFQQGARVIDNIFALKWYVFWDALTRQRTDGALIRIMTPLYEGEDLDDAELRLKDFAQVAIPELKKFLPDK